MACLKLMLCLQLGIYLILEVSFASASFFSFFKPTVKKQIDNLEVAPAEFFGHQNNSFKDCGDSTADDLGNFKWQVLLMANSSQFFPAVLITNTSVLIDSAKIAGLKEKHIKIICPYAEPLNFSRRLVNHSKEAKSITVSPNSAWTIVKIKYPGFKHCQPICLYANKHQHETRPAKVLHTLVKASTFVVKTKELMNVSSDQIIRHVNRKRTEAKGGHSISVTHTEGHAENASASSYLLIGLDKKGAAHLRGISHTPSGGIPTERGTISFSDVTTLTPWIVHNVRDINPLRQRWPTLPKPVFKTVGNKNLSYKNCGLARPDGKQTSHVFIQVSVKNSSKTIYCKGVLLSPYVVVTAAHCIPVDSDSKTLTVYTWYHSNVENREEFYEMKPTKTIIHPKYNEQQNTENDIALLLFESGFQLGKNKFSPACLWNRDSRLPLNKVGKVNVDGDDVVDYTIISHNQCQRDLPSSFARNIAAEHTFCAKTSRDDISACHGDSGGGLLIFEEGRYFLRGIVSTGVTNKNTSKCTESAFFMDVPYYTDWILSETNNLYFKSSFATRFVLENFSMNLKYFLLCYIIFAGLLVSILSFKIATKIANCLCEQSSSEVRRPLTDSSLTV